MTVSSISPPAPSDAIFTCRGKSGARITCSIPECIAIVDGHMHIQSGHVGSLPFAIAPKITFSLRRKTLDLPHAKLHLLKREYLDKDAAELYENRIQPFVYLLAAGTDGVAGKVKKGADGIGNAASTLQRQIFRTASRFCALITKWYTSCCNGTRAVDKKIINQVEENLRVIEVLFATGELLTLRRADTISRKREGLNTDTDLVQRKADRLTCTLIDIATHITEFQLTIAAVTERNGASVLQTIRAGTRELADAAVNLLEQITGGGKIALGILILPVIQVIMKSAGEVADLAAQQFTTAQAATVSLQQHLTDLSDYLEKAAASGFGNFLLIQKKKTFEIASTAVVANNQSLISAAMEHSIQREHIFAPLMAMPMDLDFAHLDRFNPDISKAKVYQIATTRYWWIRKVIDPKHDTGEEQLTLRTLLPPKTSPATIEQLRAAHEIEEEHGKFYYFHSRLSATKPGHHFWVHSTEYKVYEYWEIQLKDTIRSAVSNPWSIVPFYHFEPRRYLENIDDAFQYIMDKDGTSGTTGKEQLFIGFKLYPSLGYKPLDRRLPSLDRLYARCIEHDIPVLTHGSPGGAFTHDYPLYFDYDRAERVPPTVTIDDLDQLNHSDKKTYYFMQEYGSPHAWEQVLSKYPKLRLCIAHFCGSDNRPDSTDEMRIPLSGWNSYIDPEGTSWNETRWNQKLITLMQKYSTLYTDLSSQKMDEETVDNMANAIIRWPELRKRILFGTDWYMTELEYLTFGTFSEQMRAGIEAIDRILRGKGVGPETDPPLWQWFTEINPFRFFRFDRIAKEYTRELERCIELDTNIPNYDIPDKISTSKKQKRLIYKIAHKIKTLGELPDAVTID